MYLNWWSFDFGISIHYQYECRGWKYLTHKWVCGKFSDFLQVDIDSGSMSWWYYRGVSCLVSNLSHRQMVDSRKIVDSRKQSSSLSIDYWLVMLLVMYSFIYVACSTFYLYSIFYFIILRVQVLHNIHIATETETKTTTDIINKRITLSTRVVRNTIKYNTHTHRYIHYGNAWHYVNHTSGRKCHHDPHWRICPWRRS